MAFCLSLVFPVVAIAFFAVPLAFRPLGLDLLVSLLIASALGIAQFALYLAAFFAKKLASFRIALASLVACTAISSILLSIRLDGDFLKPLYTMFSGIYVLLVFRTDAFGSARDRILRALTIAAQIGVALTSAWILLMSYEALVELHPERAKFLCMNLYSLIIVCVLLSAISWARAGKRRRLEIAGDRFVVDEFDFSKFLAESDLGMLSRLVANGGAATCGEIAAWLGAGALGASDWALWDCETCKRESYTASRCPKYKNIYNRILIVRKLFEALKIGTVLAPANKLKIRDEGWSIRFAKDVVVGPP